MDAEWVSAARDLDTWPGAREVARLRIRRDGARRARKLCGPAVLADERDRETLRGMAAHGMQVRITVTPLPYTMSSGPALVSGACALFEAAGDTATDLAAFFRPDRP